VSNIIADPCAPTEPTRSPRTVSPTTRLAPVSEAPRVHVTECLSAQWAVSPAGGAVYVLAGSSSEVGRRLDEALAAYYDLCSSRWPR
jgi:hypothetical protein